MRLLEDGCRLSGLLDCRDIGGSAMHVHAIPVGIWVRHGEVW